MSVLDQIYGNLVVVRPPAPANVNKAGANYKSEVAYTEYFPRRAFDEWLSICDAIVRCGGDALFQLEPEDDALLDAGDLEVDGDGDIRPQGAREVLANLQQVQTGRVFTANGPWVVADEQRLRVIMPNMLAHRRAEAPYYRELLGRIGDEANLSVDFIDTPYRWEGMADVAAVGNKVVLTYAVPGHYDFGTEPKSERSSREGVAFAADEAGVPESARIYAELVYPHFHGDTVHFGARPPGRPPVLVHYPAGLWGDGAQQISSILSDDTLCLVSRQDAVDHYATNSRQIGDGILVTDSITDAFAAAMEGLGLHLHRVSLFELFGKAGGGPACATLYLPVGLSVSQRSPLRFSVSRRDAVDRRHRVPQMVRVSHDYFTGRRRG